MIWIQGQQLWTVPVASGQTGPGCVQLPVRWRGLGFPGPKNGGDRPWAILEGHGSLDSLSLWNFARARPSLQGFSQSRSHKGMSTSVSEPWHLRFPARWQWTCPTIALLPQFLVYDMGRNSGANLMGWFSEIHWYKIQWDTQWDLRSGPGN